MTSNPHRTTGAAPSLSAFRQDGVIVVRIEAPPPVEAPDELIAFPFGLEASAARRLIRDGTLTAAKIGRRTYARRSDVVGLVDKLASMTAVPTADTDDDYQAIVRKARR